MKWVGFLAICGAAPLWQDAASLGSLLSEPATPAMAPAANDFSLPPMLSADQPLPGMLQGAAQPAEFGSRPALRGAESGVRAGAGAVVPGAGAGVLPKGSAGAFAQGAQDFQAPGMPSAFVQDFPQVPAQSSPVMPVMQAAPGMGMGIPDFPQASMPGANPWAAPGLAPMVAGSLFPMDPRATPAAPTGPSLPELQGMAQAQGLGAQGMQQWPGAMSAMQAPPGYPSQAMSAMQAPPGYAGQAMSAMQGPPGYPSQAMSAMQAPPGYPGQAMSAMQGPPGYGQAMPGYSSQAMGQGYGQAPLPGYDMSVALLGQQSQGAPPPLSAPMLAPVEVAYQAPLVLQAAPSSGDQARFDESSRISAFIQSMSMQQPAAPAPVQIGAPDPGASRWSNYFSRDNDRVRR